MVHFWLPDPPNENVREEIEPSTEIIATVETSSDEDDGAYDGYQPLRGFPNCVEPINDSSDEEEENEAESNANKNPTSETNAVNPNPSLPPIVPIEKVLVTDVWNAPAPHDIEMDVEKANEVRQAMANFTLPSTSIPDWAASIPEDQWKEQLINRIQSKRDNSSEKK